MFSRKNIIAHTPLRKTRELQPTTLIMQNLKKLQTGLLLEVWSQITI